MSLINPSDSLERQNEKLRIIAEALMRRVEQKTENSGLAYQQFERAALLETEVSERTRELERTLNLLQESNARLEIANFETETARANLSEAIETINEGFALFDPDETLVLFNSRFCRDIDDITDFLVKGMHFTDYVELISRSSNLSIPNNQTPAEWAKRRLTRHRHNHVVFNVRLSRNRWIQVSEHRTARGGTVILQTDVTEIMRLERQERDNMRDQQAKTLQATLDHLNQGVCIFDQNLTLVGWNKNMDSLLALPPQQAVHGLKFSEVIELLHVELTFGEGFDLPSLERWAQDTNKRKPVLFELKRNNKEILSVFAQEMPDRGFVMSFTDVTVEREYALALSEMNERLEQGVRDRTTELGIALAEAERANASKSRFVAAASHDLLQPLSAAKLFLSSLATHLTDTTNLSTLQKAETALVGVENIIEALLDISKLDAGKAVFRVQPVRLSAILGPLSDELTPTAQAKGLSLTIVDSQISVLSDPGYLHRIVQNLVGNAVKYTNEGAINVVERRDGESVWIDVHDTGPGIAPEHQKMIFREFERPELSAGEPGLGLGLAIVERACLGLDHKLALTSEPGKGSCFSIQLPVAPTVQIPVEPTKPTPRKNGKVLEGAIVLVVENDEQLGNALAQLLEENGAEVLLCSRTEDAKALLIEIDIAPDFLLLDYQLGTGHSGVQLYQDICVTFGDLPAAIISANRSEELEKTCAGLSLPLLPKPLDKQVLLQQIEKGLRKQPAP